MRGLRRRLGRKWIGMSRQIIIPIKQVNWIACPNDWQHPISSDGKAMCVVCKLKAKVLTEAEEKAIRAAHAEIEQ